MKKTTQTLVGTVRAAQRVGVSESTMLRYAKQGVCAPLVTEEGRHLFRPADIAAAKQYRSK